MRAAVYNQYGGPEVISIKDVETPRPNENEILVKVKASSLTPGDSVMRKGEPFASRFVAGLTKPKNPVLGHEFAGEVVEVGSNTTKYKVGDRVFGSLGLKSRGHAEYLSISEDENVSIIPEGTAYAETAAIPVGALTALYFLKKGMIKKGQRVLINGGSGSVGTYAIQLAKYFGTEVTAVSSARNKELVTSVGADNFIDYKTQDFSEGEVQYDLIFDAVGKLNYTKSARVLSPSGFFVTTAVKASLLLQMAQTNITGKKRVFSGLMKGDQEGLEFITSLLKEGKIKSVIDRTYALEEIRSAHAYVDGGHKKGNVIITLN